MSLLTSFTSPNAIDPFAFDETIPWWQANGAAFQSANNLLLAQAPKRPYPITVASIRFYLGVTSGNLDVGVWSFDGTTLTLLTSSGSTAAGTGTAVQTVPLLTPKTRNPGDRWFYGICFDNATATYGRTTIVSGAIGLADYGSGAKASSFPLASNAASILASNLVAITAVPWLRGVTG